MSNDRSGGERGATFNPTRSGYRAQVIKGLMPQPVKAVIEERARGLAGGGGSSSGVLPAAVIDVQFDPAVQEWRGRIIREGGGRHCEDAFNAAVVSYCTERAFDHETLLFATVEAVARRLIPVLQPAIGTVKLDTPKIVFPPDREPVPSRGRAPGVPHFAEIHIPIAGAWAVSVARLRVSTVTGANSRPYGWVPSQDLLSHLRFFALGQVGRVFRPHAFLSSVFVHHIRAAGMADVVDFGVSRCPNCKTVSNGWPRSEVCDRCGGELKRAVERRCFSVNYLGRCRRSFRSGRVFYLPPDDDPPDLLGL